MLQMAQYYRNRPRASDAVAADTLAADLGIVTNNAPVLSEFDKHRKQLLTDDAQEGWVSELRRYLSTMQGDVTKDTDLVEWWQVRRSKCGPCHPLTNFRRIMHNCILHLHALPSMYFPLKLRQFLVNGYSLAVNKSRLTAERVWVPPCLKS
jgi:hypothetical protein